MLRSLTQHRLWMLVSMIGVLVLLSACNLGNQQQAPTEISITDAPTDTQPPPTRTLQGDGGVPTANASPTSIGISTAVVNTAVPTAIAQLPPTRTPLPASIVIVSPIPGNVVSGNVQVVGSASHPNFLQYRLEYGSEPNPGNLWFPITGSVQNAVIASSLGVWNTTSGATPDGTYQLRLRVFLQDGSEQVTRIGGIRVQNQEPTPVPTNTPTIPRPIAAFDAQPTEGEAPLIVRFSNQSQGQIDTYNWNFGDGGSSTEPNPAYAYREPGTYDATLRVSGPGGTSNVSQQIVVRSPQAPEAAFIPSTSSGTAPLTVSFDNRSTTQGLVTYRWDFGDGTTSDAAEPTHTFEEVGTYNVILRASGTGGVDTAVRQITVENPTVPAPSAAISANPTSGVAPLTVTFTNNSTGQATRYLWDFDNDGTTDRVTESNRVVAINEYDEPGQYTARLTAIGEGGQTSATTQINVQRPQNAPQASFEVSTDSGTAPLRVEFTNTTTGEVTTYQWIFGDGGRTQAVSPAHAYGAAGNYTVTLTATGPGGTTRATRTIRVQPRIEPPSAGFAAEPSEGEAPLTVNFINQSTGQQLDYFWDFQSDNSNDSTDPNPSFTYTEPGTYTVTLRVQDPQNRVAIAENTVTVRETVALVPTATMQPPPTNTATVQLPPPEASFTVNPPGVQPGGTVTFTNTSTGTVDSVEWDFNGDGVVDSQNAGTVTFTYNEQGRYQASLTVRGAGTSDTFTQTVPVVPAPDVSTAVPTATNTATSVPTATSTATIVPTATDTATVAPTATNTATVAPTATDTATLVPTATDTATLAPSPTSTATIVPTATDTATVAPTATDTATLVPTATNTATVAPSPTSTATIAPTATETATVAPTATETATPTVAATPTEDTATVERPLLVVSNLGGNDDIFAYREDGTDVRNLTSNPATDTHPAWSPDKTRIAFASDRAQAEVFDIYVLTLADGNVQRLTQDTGSNVQPAWSPDGSQIAFISNRTGNDDLFVMNADGTAPTPFTNTPAAESHPTWSPDGSRIAYSSDATGNGDLYSVNADGAEPTRLTTSELPDSEPVWSPTDAVIAYTATVAGEGDNPQQTDIFLVNTDGSNPRALTSNPSNESQAAWSPDGTELVFLSDRNATVDVFRITRDTLTQALLINTPDGITEVDLDW